MKDYATQCTHRLFVCMHTKLENNSEKKALNQVQRWHTAGFDVDAP